MVLPHVPGHEPAGTVAAVGADVRRWRVGDRVTVPFVNACGRCARCAAGDPQVCPHQTQPGFTHWGSLAQYVALDAADVNLVGLPAERDDATDVAAEVAELTGGGTYVSLDALGAGVTCEYSIRSLRPRAGTCRSVCCRPRRAGRPCRWTG